MRLKKRKYRYRIFVLVTTISMVMVQGCKEADSSTLALHPVEIDYEEDLNHMVFTGLPERWDEAVPLGNGVLGALVYKKGERLRMALDRIDLWDTRHTAYLSSGKHTFSRLYDLWKTGHYQKARDLRDSLRVDPYPSKIPVGAIDFKNIDELGTIKKVDLFLKEAICRIDWNSGTTMETFVAADREYGWFQFKNLKNPIDFEIVPPNYDGSKKTEESDDKGRNEVVTLGYPSPLIEKKANTIVYRQKVVQGDGYAVFLHWKLEGQDLTGVWSIANSASEDQKMVKDKSLKTILREDKSELLKPHKNWWGDFWGKSQIQLPDSILQSQWIKDVYKFGACTGISKTAISLQSIWTADNGRMPPWSGNFTNDLNTEESYWGAFNGNHLKEAKVFTEWLWRTKPRAESYTKEFFGVEGLSYPGICTIEGDPMVAWWPYTHSPSTAAWLAQNFYWYWRYSMDRAFLKERAYPWLKETTIFFDNFSETDTNGKKKLPLSSSPEINDDKAEAWFSKTTNHDLSLIHWAYDKAIELGKELGETEDVRHFESERAKWPPLAVSETEGLLIAPDYSLSESHRHLGHLMAIYPLGTLDVSEGGRSQKIIKNSLAHLDSLGSKEWVGWSYPWYSLLRARQGNGDRAAEYLRIFAENFCGTNSFHLNGDQSGKGYSNFTYRPFTLEANFGFIGAVNEMLLQSHTDAIAVFPAVPEHWKDIAFKDLRAQGAFTIAANMKNGLVENIGITASMGGAFRLKNPFENRFTMWVNGQESTSYSYTDGVISVMTAIGDSIVFTANRNPT